MGWQSRIINKRALKRIAFIYVPFFVAMYMGLLAVSFLTAQKEAPLNLDTDFKGKLPIVYHDVYNITFFGLEKLHPFDSTKYRGVYDRLLGSKLVLPQDVIVAAPPARDVLLQAHDAAYLDRLQSSWALAQIMELGFLRFFPSRLSRQLVLRPMLYQTGGSLLAARAALQKGWAINLGGGFHHASHADGQGFCPLADISLIIKNFRQAELAQKFMIIDLDAHQGNGHGRDFIGDDDVYVVDVYNADIYPNDSFAKQGIDQAALLSSFTGDSEYLQKVTNALDAAFGAFEPDMVIYAAGTDILAGDPLGALDISAAGVRARDVLVFDRAFARSVPVVMLLSGGYQKSNAEVIAESILNLHQHFDLLDDPVRTKDIRAVDMANPLK